MNRETDCRYCQRYDRACGRHEARRAVGAPVKIGELLANGATVLQTRPIAGNLHGNVFLALWRDEFVTWLGDADGTGTTIGHYYRDDLAAALEDFQTR